MPKEYEYIIVFIERLKGKKKKVFESYSKNKNILFYIHDTDLLQDIFDE